MGISYIESLQTPIQIMNQDLEMITLENQYGRKDINE